MRSITLDLSQKNYLDCTLNPQIDILKNKMFDHVQDEPKSLKEDQKRQTKFFDSKKQQQYSEKTSAKLPIIFNVKSKSSQIQTKINQNQNSNPEIMSNLKKKQNFLRSIIKSIDQILSPTSKTPSLHQIITDQKNDKNSKDYTILNLSNFLRQNQNQPMDIGKYIQEKIEQKRINNFTQLYKNASKYQIDDDYSGFILSRKERQKLEAIKNRRKLIIKTAQKKSPKFLYPFGTKIRVPNYSLGQQYFQMQQSLTNRTQNYIYSQKKKKHIIQEDEISNYKLDSPPKYKFYPTSSMQEDYLNIKVQQFVRSLQ